MDKNSLKGMLLFLFIGFLFSDWEPDVRLTNQSARSKTAGNDSKGFAVAGNFIHLVWYDKRDGNDEIYYKRSQDQGATWPDSLRLSDNSFSSRYPSISANGSLVYVVWLDNRDGNWEIYYKKSTDNGNTWGSDYRLTNNDYVSYCPSIATSGANIHIFWYDNRDGNWEIYYKKSSDNGNIWSSENRLTNASGHSWNPMVVADGDNVYVVWFDKRDGNFEVYFQKSTDYGNAWLGSDMRITNDALESVNPSIAISGSNISIVWRQVAAGIYYINSTDQGNSWGSSTLLSSGRAPSYSSIAAQGSNINVVWQDVDVLGAVPWRIGVWFKRSIDNGTTWDADYLLINPGESKKSWFPIIASIDDTTLGVVWYDNRDGNEEIYFKKGIFPVDVIPPNKPYIPMVEKISADVQLTWNKVTTDTLGNTENMKYYVVYRGTTPDFIPGPTDSIGAINYPDTIFTDINALNASTNYYYLIKAVDVAKNKSNPSNMGYKFRQFLNENPMNKGY